MRLIMAYSLKTKTLSFVSVKSSEKMKGDIMYNNLQGIQLRLPQRHSPDSLAPS